MSETINPSEHSEQGDGEQVPFGLFENHDFFMRRYGVQGKPTETYSIFGQTPDSLNDDD